MLSYRRKRPEARNVAEACESYLRGAYVEHCQLRGETVPVWAWMNLLAHSTAAELAQAAENGGLGPWSRARAFVAGELLDRADDGRFSLEEFQTRVLVPLELEVLACPASARWQPDQLVAALLDVMPDRPTRR